MTISSEWVYDQAETVASLWVTGETTSALSILEAMNREESTAVAVQTYALLNDPVKARLFLKTLKACV